MRRKRVTPETSPRVNRPIRVRPMALAVPGSPSTVVRLGARWRSRSAGTAVGMTVIADHDVALKAVAIIVGGIVLGTVAHALLSPSGDCPCEA